MIELPEQNPAPCLPLPSDFEAEAAILGAILIDVGALYECLGVLLPEHFSEPAHQRIFAAMLAQHATGTAPSAFTLKPVFEADPDLQAAGGGKYLASLAGAAIAVLNIRDIAAEIVKTYQRRNVILACRDAMREAFDGSVEPERMAESLMHSVHGVFSGSVGLCIKNNFEVGQEILRDLADKKQPYSTGLSRLDQAMGGGIYPGKSYGFAARKKVGKTIMAGTISYNLNLAGVKHMFICTEMGRREIHQRNIARGIDAHPFAFRGDAKDTQKFQSRIAEFVANQPKNVVYCDSPGISFAKLRQALMVGVHRHKIKGFILDYWQLVGGKSGKQNTTEHLDEVAQWISNFSREHGLWSITMAQINQDGNTRNGEGMRLAFDQVYQIHREDMSQPDAWLEMMDTRYTAWMNVGEAVNPALLMHDNGPYFIQRNA